MKIDVLVQFCRTTITIYDSVHQSWLKIILLVSENAHLFVITSSKKANQKPYLLNLISWNQIVWSL